MDAIIMAGGIPTEEDPLYEYTRGLPKAMLDICGKPMIQWVLDALNASRLVDQVVVSGLDESSPVKYGRDLTFIPNQGGMLMNIRAGAEKVLELNPDSKHVLLCSSDVPMVETEAIDWVINTAMQTDEDVYYNVIKRQVMETRFPTSRRSYVRLKDVEVCGGDVNIARTKKIVSERGIWDQLIAARKNAVKQAALLGYDTMILLLLHAITLEGAIKKVTKRLNISGRALVCPYPEVGMDVDKPNQLEIARADISHRMAAQTGAASSA
jgi:GTP:adenosylcobinamide-phosphate guanylyltransferase